MSEAAFTPQPGLLRRMAPGLAVLFWIATSAATSAWYTESPRVLSLIEGGNSTAAVLGLLLAAIFLPLALFRGLTEMARAVTVAFTILAFSMPLAWALWMNLPEIFAGDRGFEKFRLMIVTPPALGLLILLWRAKVRLASLATSAALTACYVLLVPLLVFEGEFFYGDGKSDAEALEVNVEALYQAQDGLLAAELDRLAPQTPGKAEVFGLVLGGTAHENVFRSEVEQVSAILTKTYDAKDRVVRLLNSREAPEAYPMANRSNLRAALNGMAARMGPEDVAFLYLTSHGGPDVFALTFYEAGTQDLSAAEFAEILDGSGLGAAVIVVSACYSGSFIDEIRGENRLVMTAARADRTSFGCGNGREWTEFGQSLFVHGLGQTADPEAAFELARQHVWWKELKGLRTGSYPQIDVGAGFAKAFAAVLGTS